MRLNMTPVSEELKKEIAEMLNTAEDKSAAIADAMEKVAAETQQALIQQVVAEAERASHDAEYKKTLGLANLS
jgi:chaperonin cofactor prefoldin